MNVLDALTPCFGLTGQNESLTITAPFAEAEHEAIELAGQYRLSSITIHVEIEFINIDTQTRGALYVDHDRPVFVFLSRGTYRIVLRFLSPPGAYTNASLQLEKLTFAARIRFAVAKLMAMKNRPLREWRSVLNRALKSGRRGVTGASLSGPMTRDLPADPVREPELPGPATSAGVSIIIPTKFHPHNISACVASLDRTEHLKDIVIIDNGADDPEMVACLKQLAEREDTRVIRHDAPFNFSVLCNLGARHARFEQLLFLNDDVEAMDSGWLSAMAAYLNRADVGIVGARLLYPNRALQHAGVAVNLLPGPGHPWRGLSDGEWQKRPLICAAGEVDAVTGACLLIGRDLFQELGGFDETAFPVTLNDIDLCMRARAKGYKVFYVPQATLIHKESQSRIDDDDEGVQPLRQAERKAFYDRFGDTTRQSVFYPPYLRRDTDKGYGIPGL